VTLYIESSIQDPLKINIAEYTRFESLGQSDTLRFLVIIWLQWYERSYNGIQNSQNMLKARSGPASFCSVLLSNLI
jgi:hypothetical protein